MGQTHTCRSLFRWRRAALPCLAACGGGRAEALACQHRGGPARPRRGQEYERYLPPRARCHCVPVTPDEIMAFELTEYPPRSFCEKYRKFLAPKGSLLPPQQALKNKNFGPAAAETLKKAFKITIKKLRKMRSACAACDKKEGEPDWLGDVEGTHTGGGNLACTPLFCAGVTS